MKKAVITWPEHLKGQRVTVVNESHENVYNVILPGGKPLSIHGDNLDFTGVLGIGARSRDGLLEITDTNREDSSTLRVTVRELIGGVDGWTGGLPIRRMRDLARRAVDGTPARSREVNRVYSGGCWHVTFTFTTEQD